VRAAEQVDASSRLLESAPSQTLLLKFIGILRDRIIGGGCLPPSS